MQKPRSTEDRVFDELMSRIRGEAIDVVRLNCVYIVLGSKCETPDFQQVLKEAEMLERFLKKETLS